MKILTCGHCATQNTVDICSRCSRAFVVTKARVAEGMRRPDDAPYIDASTTGVQPCDFCLSKDMHESVTQRMERGVRQRTCPVCAKEFLSAHGLTK